jgi:hypothetical protein
MMEMQIIQVEGKNIAEIISDKIIISETQEALDLMADAAWQGAVGLIINAENFTPAFFDLKTGIAGDILQKFSTYNMRLAIIGDFSAVKSKSLNDFIFESNKCGRISFVSSREEAIRKLSR